MIVVTRAHDGRKAYVNPEQVCAVYTECSGEYTIIQFSGSTRIMVLESVDEVFSLIDSPERKKGTWRKMNHNLGYECSFCGWESDATYNFCPNCGTDMEN